MSAAQAAFRVNSTGEAPKRNSVLAALERHRCCFGFANKGYGTEGAGYCPPGRAAERSSLRREAGKAVAAALGSGLGKDIARVLFPA